MATLQKYDPTAKLNGQPRPYLWDTLGLRFEKPMPAMEAFEKFGGYEIAMEPVITESGLPTNHQAIVRAPVRGDYQRRVFAVVSEHYELITHREACEMWDTHTGIGLTGIATTGEGKTLFLTAPLPQMEILGDVVENYLFFINPLTGNQSIQGRLAPVMMTCTNQMWMVEQRSAEFLRVPHRRNARGIMAEWLKSVYIRFIEKTHVMAGVYTHLARTRIKPATQIQILAEIFPDPKLEDGDVVTPQWEKAREKMIEYRRDVMHLFQGAGRGSDHPSRTGTAWGFYGAITEWADRTPMRGGLRALAESNVNGQRARIKEDAFELLVTAAN